MTPRGDTDAPVVVASDPPLLFDGVATRAVREWRYERRPEQTRSQRQVIRLIFRPEDTQIYEPRDVIWAWAMLLFAGFIVLWGLKELFLPTKVIECTDQGLSLKITGPFRPPATIAWELVDDVRGMDVEDEDDRVAMLAVRVLDPKELPANPWGARWIGERELAILAEDWQEHPQEIADQIVDYAVDAAKREATARTASVWREEEG